MTAPSRAVVVLVAPAATYRATDFVQAAARLDLDLVVATDADVVPLRSENVVNVDLDRPAEAGDAIAARAPDAAAVVAVDGPGAITAAHAAERLGLPHSSPDAVATALDKVAQRRAAACAGVTQPAFVEAGPDASTDRIADRLGFPVVVKPTGLSGGRGVIRADDHRDLAQALRRAHEIQHAATGRLGRVVIERYVEGTELAIELLVRGDAVDPVAVFGKPETTTGPTFPETVLISPPTATAATVAAAIACCQSAARAVGLRTGPVHAECRVDGTGRAWFLELAPRTVGGLCSRGLRFRGGATLEEVVLGHALGGPVVTASPEPVVGVAMVLADRPGRLARIDGVDRALDVDGVAAVTVSATPRQVVGPLPEDGSYLAFVYATGPDQATVHESLRTARGALQPVIDP